jgi:hypothetical protein
VTPGIARARAPATILVVRRALALLVLAACGGSSTSNTPDARPSGADAAVSIDAPPGTPDAMSGAADARPADAPISIADAALPDAPLITPDAAPDARPPDARPPDASTPDASTPDASTPDASQADAGFVSDCLPQCFVEIVGALVLTCPPVEPCTSSVFDIQNPFSFAVCYSNGVKLVANINVGEGVTTFQAKEADGDVCYTYEATATQDSTTILIKNREGAQVARVVVPDNDNPDEQQYFCGDSGPFAVDLSSPECEDESGFGDTSDCPMNASCTP